MLVFPFVPKISDQTVSLWLDKSFQLLINTFETECDYQDEECEEEWDHDMIQGCNVPKDITCKQNIWNIVS